MNIEVTIEKRYHYNGEVEAEVPYVNGKKHGPQTGWEANGTRCFEMMWREGKEHGMATLRYDNGQKWYEGMWRDHKQHGVWSNWRESGGKEDEIYYIEGKRYGVIKWDIEGNVTEARFQTPPPTRTPTINLIAKLKNHVKKSVS